MPEPTYLIDTIVHWPEGEGRWTINLKQGERFEDPTRPKEFFYGPATFEFIRFPDGGVKVWFK